MSSWGLLRGLGEGLSFAGQQMALSQEEQAKEARLQEYQRVATEEARQYQEGQTQKQWAREDERRARDVSTMQKAVKDGRDVAIGLNVAGQPVSEIDLGQAKADYGSIKSNKAGFFDVATKTWYPNPAGSGGDNKPIITQDADGNPIAVNWDGSSIKAVPLTPEGNSAAPTKSELARAKALQQQIDSINKQGETAELAPELTKMREDAQREIQNIFFKPDGSRERPLQISPGDSPEKYQGKYARGPDGVTRFIPAHDKTADNGATVVTPTVAPTADPRVKNADGSMGYAPSMTVTNPDGTVAMVPMVDEQGKALNESQAAAQYKATGKHYGIFKDEKAAAAGAGALYSGEAKIAAPGETDKNAPPGLIGKGAATTGLLDKKAAPTDKAQSPAAGISEERAMLEAEKSKKAAEASAKAKAQVDAGKQKEKEKYLQSRQKEIDAELSEIKAGLAAPQQVLRYRIQNFGNPDAKPVDKLKSKYAERLVQIIENPNSTTEQIAAAKALFKSTR